MLKRITALLLTFCMALSLLSCGKKPPSLSGETSVADVGEQEPTAPQAMDVFQTWEAIRKLKEYRFSFQINSVNSDGTTGHSLLLMEGVSFARLKQAAIQVTLEEIPLTTFYVNGSTVLMDAKTASETLAKQYTQLTTLEEEDKADFQADLLKIAEKLPTQYVSFDLGEDPWTSSESGTLSVSREMLKQVYDSVKESVSSQTQNGENSSSLLLASDDLQAELLKLTGSLVENQDVYKQGVVQTLKAGFADVLVSYGMNAEDWFITKWETVEQLHETLSHVEASDTWQDWSLQVVASGNEESGYTIDWTDNRERSRNYRLSVAPAQAQEQDELPKSTASSEVPEPLAELYSYSEIYRRIRQETPSEAGEVPPENLNGNEEEPAEQLEVTLTDQHEYIGFTDLYTEDGKKRSVPVPLNYAAAEVERENNAVVDIFLSSNGYVLEYSSVSARDPQKQVQDNMMVFEETFRDEYGYSITQKGTVKTSADQKTAMGGIGYYDEELEQDVTILTSTITIPDSEKSVCLDLFVYSRSVTDQDLSAIQELLEALGVDAPLTITKN